MMKNRLFTSFLFSVIVLMFSGCGAYEEALPTNTGSSITATATEFKEQTAKESEPMMDISVGDKEFQIVLEKNDTVTALTELLPITLDMSELNGNEKYYYLDSKLPSAPEKVSRITAGDIMLYGDNCLVVFYKSFDTSYTYTKIGHIKDTTGLTDALGSGGVTVSFQLAPTNVIYTVQDIRDLSDFILGKPTENDLTDKHYDLDNDGIWSTFDIVLMRKKILDQKNMKTEFDFDSRTVLLNSGYEMPILGLGTWTQDDETVEGSVYTALKDGYRLIDTAQYYGNETGVGNGLKRAVSEGIVKREDVFITTKVMPSNYERAYQSIDDSLKRLNVDYIDLMLIHQSGSNDTEVYKALCQGVPKQ